MGILLVYSASTMYFQQVYIYTCTYEGFLQSCIPLPEVKIAENALLYIVYIYKKKETTWSKKKKQWKFVNSIYHKLLTARFVICNSSKGPNF